LKDRKGPALVYTSRGCPFACGYYCPYPYGFGSKIRFRSPELVGQELELLNKKYGVDGVLFRDQVFTVKRKHTEAVCKQIIDRGLDIQWVCETKYDRVDPELLDLMKQAGCVAIHYGLESGDEELFWSVGKPGGKESPAEAMQRFTNSINATKAAGISAYAHTIVGLPGETRKTIRATNERLKSLNIDGFSAGVITPYPGTRLYEEATANNWIREHTHARYTAAIPVIEYKNFNQRDMQKARNLLMDTFEGQKPFWKRIAHRISKLVS
jgi:radical SAM superfamily enzyme YgiQ (UPF0313 family)